MPTAAIRMSGLALMLGGACLALFVLLHPYGELVGDVALRSAWTRAHTLHLIGALCTLFGLVGLYAIIAGKTKTLGLAAFSISFAGMALFVGTGMSTAWLWPAIARDAPSFVAEGGAMFTAPRARVMTGAPYLLMLIGFVLLGTAVIRSKQLPKAAGWLLIVGIILFCAPVEPFGPAPWIVRVAGSVVFGASLVWLGAAVFPRPGEPLS